MKITLDYRNPSPLHCDVAVFVNGALAGVLRLRQDELGTFQHILNFGMDPRRDEFLGTGNPGPDPLGFTCPRCQRTSHHPQDIAQGYCGACPDWTKETP